MKLKANGIEINYEKQGSGPVVTMSHSLACNLHMWDEQAAALAERYTVVRFDTRGHGHSSAPEGAYSLDQMGDDLKGLLDGLGIRETHFVGLSMGGMIGQTFALKHGLPDVVESFAINRIVGSLSRHSECVREGDPSADHRAKRPAEALENGSPHEIAQDGNPKDEGVTDISAAFRTRPKNDDQPDCHDGSDEDKPIARQQVRDGQEESSWQR